MPWWVILLLALIAAILLGLLIKCIDGKLGGPTYRKMKRHLKKEQGLLENLSDPPTADQCQKLRDSLDKIQKWLREPPDTALPRVLYPELMKLESALGKAIAEKCR